MTRRQKITAPMVEPRSYTNWLFAAALAVAVVLVYQPAWQGGFIWDDDGHVTKPELRSWHGLYRIWFDVGATQQYYPLLHSAFWIEHKLWGDAPLGYHLVNILLHATAALMVAAVLSRLAVPGAFLAAAIFALHPVCVESVAWITELKNVLSAVFYLAALMLYLRFDQSRKKSLYAGALLLFVICLLTKTVTATLPAAILVIFWWQRGRLSWQRDVLPLLPFFLLGAAAGLFTAWVERKLIGAEGASFELTIIDRFLIAGRVIWFYLGKLFWPVDLIFIYPRWDIDQSVWWQYLFPVAALMLLAALWTVRRRWRGPLAGALFFVGTLFPVLGFFNVFPFIFSFVADHFQYLASLGVIVVTSAGIAMLLERLRLWRRLGGYVLCLTLLAVLATLTWRQNRMYADVITLYQTTIEKNPNCWMAYNNIGVEMVRVGRLPEAIDEYQKALALNPEFAEAHNNLASALEQTDRVQEAIEHYRKALVIKPYSPEIRYNFGNALSKIGRHEEAIECYRQALALKPDYPEAHNNLAVRLVQIGRLPEAIEQFEQVLRIKQDHPEAHNNLAVILVQQGRLQEAIEHYRQALALKPDYLEAHYNLGNALVKIGRFQEGIDHYKKALQLKPDYVDVYNKLGNVLMQTGELQEAIEQYKQAIEFKSDFVEAYFNLAQIYAQLDWPPEAIAVAQKALELAKSQGQIEQAEQIEEWLNSYRAKNKD